MATKVDLYSTTSGTSTSVNLVSRATESKTSCQQSDFSQSLDQAQQQREAKSSKYDKYDKSDSTSKTADKETAKSDADGKDVKEAAADKPNDAQKADGKDAAKEAKEAAAEKAADTPKSDKADKPQDAPKAEGEENPNPNPTDAVNPEAGKLATVAEALVNMPLAELDTYFKGDSRLELMAQINALKGAGQEEMPLVQQGQQLGELMQSAQQGQNVQSAADGEMAAVLAEMTPVADGETMAMPEQAAYTRVQYNATSMQALLANSRMQSQSVANDTPVTQQTTGQQMLEMLAGQRVYTPVATSAETTAKAEEATPVTQLTDLVGDVEVVQEAPKVQTGLQDSQLFQQQQENPTNTSTNSQGQQQGHQMVGEAAFDVVAPGEAQNAAQDNSAANNQGFSFQQTMEGLQNNPTDAAQMAQQPARTYQDYNVPGQIVDQAKLLLRGQNSEMTIKLNPEHLGELTLRVSVNGNGGVTATFHTDNALVRGILETTMIQLKDQLAEQGIKVDQVEVQTGLPEDGQLPEYQQGDYQQGQQGQQTHVRSEAADREDFEETSEALAAGHVNASEEIIRDSEGNEITRGIDYSV